MTNTNITQRKTNSDLEAERSLLQALDLNPDLTYELKVSEDDFEDKIHQQIFTAITTAYQEKRETSSVFIDLEDDLARSYFIDKVQGQWSGNFEPSQDIVQTNSLRRKITEWCRLTAMQVPELGYSDIMDILQESLNEFSTTDMKDDTVTSAQASMQALEFIDSFLSGDVDPTIPSYLKDLDNIIGGFGNGQLITIGAPSSHGKTALALTMVLNQAKHGKKIGFFSLEMSADELSKRLASMKSNDYTVKVSYDEIIKRIATKTQEDLYFKALQEVGNFPMYFNDNTNITINQLIRVATKWKSQYDIDILYVDYIQLVKGDKDAQSREREVASVTKALKGLSKHLKIPIVALSQVNREINGGAKILRTSHLRESSAIEHDSDKVIMMWRPALLEGEGSDIPTSQTELIVDKNRQGKRGGLKLHYYGDLTLFMDRAKGETYFNKSSTNEVPF